MQTNAYSHSNMCKQSSIPQSSMITTASTARSQNVEDVMGFIYDIPKDPLFTNKSLTSFFQENGYKNTQVQIIKGSKNVDENSRPMWSGRAKFKTQAYLK